MSSTGSPIALVGTISLFAAYILGAWCVAAGIAGNARKSRRLVSSAVYGLFGFGALTALASTLMIYAFVTHDFSIRYVAATSDTSMSTWYKVTAFWGGLDGSLLFWVLVLSLFSMVAIAMNHRRHRDMIGYVVATIMVVQVFFLSLLIFTKNPFSTFLTTPPTDGQGLNPLLQNYWMVIHPPSLYIGFVAATIPFAFGIGALASGRLDDMWLGSVRTWMLICFFFLSLGLILGGRWAYEELGWGGYWAWDPVENAGFMPWFTATAFLHSAIIQEQRGMMKKWNLSLVILTFFLTIFGTFMTRSGAVQSVHAFGEDNVLALQFIVFMALILVVSVGLLVFRANKLGSPIAFDSFYSREFAFLVNNWILLGCAFFVLFATMFPTISEAIDGARVSVGIEFFNRWITPFGLILLLLAGAAPLLAWRKTTRERLYTQFMFPTVLCVLTIVGLVIFVPQSTRTSAMFADTLHLPVSLINFGFCAFVFGSIIQEFVRGVIVRRRQTGSDPVSSLFGLILTKRRKYGGYIVHLGIAVLFIGFAGKTYDRMIDRTVAKPIHAVMDATMLPQGQTVSPEVISLVNTATHEMLRDDVGLADQLARNIERTRDTTRIANAGQLREIVGLGPKALASLEAYAKAPHHVTWQGPAQKRLSVTSAKQTLVSHGVDPNRINVQQVGQMVVATSAYQVDVEIQARIRKNLSELAEVPTEMIDLRAKPAAWFEFADYRFVYDALIHTSDDHKDAVTAQVSIWHEGAWLATVYPAKWDYHKSADQATSEVAIKVRFSEDVYVVLTGYDLDAELANFRVYVNPLISWVWIGFLILTLGTFVCLIPQGLVDRVGTRPQSRIGRAADVGLFIGVILGLILAGSAAAAPVEHVPAGQGMGQSGVGYASMNRPANETDGKAMKELICPCGCARQTIHECDCKTAADLRENVQTILADYDMADTKQRAAGYDKVLEYFVHEYGERVLATPKSKVSWLFPSLAVVGGLGLLFVVGRRWIVKPGKDAATGATKPGVEAPKKTAADDAYADKLDDELAETD